MGGAGAAGALDLLAEFTAGAEEADVDGVDALTAGVGDVCGGLAFEVDAAEQFGVSRWQGGEELHHALAEGLFVCGVGGLGPVVGEFFQGAVARFTTAVGVDDGVTQDAVKPGDDAFGIFRDSVCAQGFEEAFLNEVGGEFGIACAGAGEADEGVQMLDQGVS